MVEECALDLKLLEADRDHCPKPGIAVELLGATLTAAKIAYKLVPVRDITVKNVGALDPFSKQWTG